MIGEELKDMSGLFQRSPLAGTAMLLFMLSLGGIPPTAGFMGKFWLFSAAIDGGYYWLAVIGVLNSADLPLLLPARGRLHVVQGRADRLGAGDLAGHGSPAGDHHRRDDRHRRLSAAAVRPGRHLGANPRRVGERDEIEVRKSRVDALLRPLTLRSGADACVLRRERGSSPALHYV